MNGALLTLRQLRYENKSFWRNPASVFFTFAFPLMFLFIFNGLFGGEFERGGRTIDATTFYVPAIGAFSIISATYTNIAVSVSILRDEGILKRIRGTPLPPWGYLTARMMQAMFVATILILIVVLAGEFIWGIELPSGTLGPFILIFLVGAASFCALGLAFTALIPNSDAAPPMVNASILPLLFVSDIFISLEDAPAWLTTVSNLFPVKHFAEAMHEAFDPITPTFQVDDLLIVAAWGVAGLLLAVRFFAWEPRR
jgi:ABC-2 type transport system permease protein